jgi:hypothetical protein
MTIIPEIQKLIDGVTAKRPKTVLDHIVKYGFVTTDDLKQIYGYNHPPRAARDVKELGIPLVTFKVVGSDGRRIAAYKLGDTLDVEANRLSGRKNFAKKFKQQLLDLYGEQCSLCGNKFPKAFLQIDHKVPYQVAGDKDENQDPKDFMLVCGSCNRIKSWACEHCANWLQEKKIEVCQSCMWASPEAYTHIALEQRRSLTINWAGEAIADYEQIKIIAQQANMSLEEYIKTKLAKAPRVRLDE